MTSFGKFVNIPFFLQIEKGALKKISQLLLQNSLFFENPLIVSGTGKTSDIAKKYVKGFKKTSFYYVSNNDISAVKELRSMATQIRPDVIIAIGGGKAIDVAKVVATDRLLPLITVPTTLSNDAPASPVSVIKENGELMSIGVRAPIGIIIDLGVIERSPLRLLKSGVGDLISNLSACEDWDLAYRLGKENMDSFAMILAKLAAESLLFCDEKNILSLRFLKTLSESTVLSGIAMTVAGTSRPASGAEHLISHALDKYFHQPALHGEQVGIATLFVFALRANFPLLERLKKFYSLLDLPQKPESINISKKDFLKAVQKAPFMRSDRFTILDTKNLKDCEEAYKLAFEDQ